MKQRSLQLVTDLKSTLRLAKVSCKNVEQGEIEEVIRKLYLFGLTSQCQKCVERKCKVCSTYVKIAKLQNIKFQFSGLVIVFMLPY